MQQKNPVHAGFFCVRFMELQLLSISNQTEAAFMDDKTGHLFSQLFNAL
jgi:hypothetical protein